MHTNELLNFPLKSWISLEIPLSKFRWNFLLLDDDFFRILTRTIFCTKIYYCRFFCVLLSAWNTSSNIIAAPVYRSCLMFPVEVCWNTNLRLLSTSFLTDIFWLNNFCNIWLFASVSGTTWKRLWWQTCRWDFVPVADSIYTIPAQHKHILDNAV